jgi:hypothetical protein
VDEGRGSQVPLRPQAKGCSAHRLRRQVIISCLADATRIRGARDKAAREQAVKDRLGKEAAEHARVERDRPLGLLPACLVMTNGALVRTGMIDWDRWRSERATGAYHASRSYMVAGWRMG